MIGRTVLRSAVVFLATSLLATAAQAVVGPGLFRAYLAPTGSDANPCTLGAPCRLLPAALAAVADGGEIWMLDSANYNTATVDITKSVTILAVPGVVGSVVATGGPAISIAAASVNVALRNLVIVPLPGGAGTDGIAMTNGASLTVDNCLIANTPGNGISVTTAATVWVADTTIRRSAGTGLYLSGGSQATVTRAIIQGHGVAGVGVFGTTAGTSTAADISHSTIDTNPYGVDASSTNATGVVRVSVSESLIVRNATAGLYVSTLGAAITFTARNNMIAANGTGIFNYGTAARVWASGNTASDNGVGFANGGSGQFESAGNNTLRNSTVIDTVGTITPVAGATK